MIPGATEKISSFTKVLFGRYSLLSKTCKSLLKDDLQAMKKIDLKIKLD